MGLVDYSESESSGAECDAPAKPPPKAAQQPASSKRPFQKVVDRSRPGRIVVNLPHAEAASSKDADSDEPPIKRARPSVGGLFSGFNSLLPAPKNASQAPILTRPGVDLKTSSAPAFSRGEEQVEDDNEAPVGGVSFPAPKRQAEPSIPEEQRPAEEVQLLGRPLMFKPLSVARNSGKKPKASVAKAAAMAPSSSATATGQTPKPAGPAGAQPPSAPAPKKAPLFSLYTEEPSEPPTRTKPGGIYEPLFETAPPPEHLHDESAQYVQQGPAPTTAPDADDLNSIANDLNLSAAARRQLFGRGGGHQAAKKVINFNMDEEYRHNETIRAAGDQQIHQPVRAIQGGKHSLKQLVHNVHNQREALEESFAKGKSNRKEASSRYGWR